MWAFVFKYLYEFFDNIFCYPHDNKTGGDQSRGKKSEKAKISRASEPRDGSSIFCIIIPLHSATFAPTESIKINGEQSIIKYLKLGMGIKSSWCSLSPISIAMCPFFLVIPTLLLFGLFLDLSLSNKELPDFICFFFKSIPFLYVSINS
ncbi:hypothetical protein BpHYR1_054538 [Brachionus plicatilis]|uniref:Uncharacterized protein n=1 Tax=Brachionus plicatilis TaxID=10195 RepID=A0A3M7RFB3_BRAPC|nr:hypothetical protein BpHYR1_054538 [Brachionus plicatilis]